jgi:MFS family permease
VTGSAARARHALASADFTRLLATRLLSQFADGLFQAYLVAQIVFLNPEGHNTAVGVAKAYAVLVIPFSVVGPLAGVLIDRWSRRRILIVSPLVKLAGVLALLPVGGGSLYLYAPALLVISVNRFFLTTATSSIPVLVEDQDLLMANSLSTVGGTVVTFMGIVAGTKLVDPIGPPALLLITAACWAGTALVAARISISLRPERPPAPMAGELGRVLRDLAAGARRLAATPMAIGPITSISLDQFLVGFVTVLSLVVFKQRFHQGVGSYGNIVAAGGVGVLAGTLTVGFFESRMAKPWITTMAFALAGLACVAVAPAITGLTILVLSFVLGLTFAWRKIPVDTMVQEAVPDRFRGRVFAVYDITYSMARVVAAGLAIPIIPRVSTGWLVFATGAAYLLWTPVLPRWVRRPVRLRIRFYAGGRADEVPRAIVVAGEEEPVEVVGSWSEERDGVRVRRFRLRVDGDLLDVVGREAGGTWQVERRSRFR